MPPCHRLTDFRRCGAQTVTSKQTTVFVNNLIWTIHGDRDNHCSPRSPLNAVYPPRNVYIININVICALGDLGTLDLGMTCMDPHGPFRSAPIQGSPNTFVYAGAGGG